MRQTERPCVDSKMSEIFFFFLLFVQWASKTYFALRWVTRNRLGTSRVHSQKDHDTFRFCSALTTIHIYEQEIRNIRSENCISILNKTESSRDKTNYLVSDQVLDKSGCIATGES